MKLKIIPSENIHGSTSYSVLIPAPKCLREEMIRFVTVNEDCFESSLLWTTTRASALTSTAPAPQGMMKASICELDEAQPSSHIWLRMPRTCPRAILRTTSSMGETKMRHKHKKRSKRLGIPPYVTASKKRRKRNSQGYIPLKGFALFRPVVKECPRRRLRPRRLDNGHALDVCRRGLQPSNLRSTSTRHHDYKNQL